MIGFFWIAETKYLVHNYPENDLIILSGRNLTCNFRGVYPEYELKFRLIHIRASPAYQIIIRTDLPEAEFIGKQKESRIFYFLGIEFRSALVD